MKNTISFEFTKQQFLLLLELSDAFRVMVTEQMLPELIPVNSSVSVTREQANALKDTAKLNKIQAIKDLRDMFRGKEWDQSYGGYRYLVGVKEAKDFIESL